MTPRSRVYWIIDRRFPHCEYEVSTSEISSLEEANAEYERLCKNAQPDEIVELIECTVIESLRSTNHFQTPSSYIVYHDGTGL